MKFSSDSQLTIKWRDKIFHCLKKGCLVDWYLLYNFSGLLLSRQVDEHCYIMSSRITYRKSTAFSEDNLDEDYETIPSGQKNQSNTPYVLKTESRIKRKRKSSCKRRSSFHRGDRKSATMRCSTPSTAVINSSTENFLKEDFDDIKVPNHIMDDQDLFLSETCFNSTFSTETCNNFLDNSGLDTEESFLKNNPLPHEILQSDKNIVLTDNDIPSSPSLVPDTKEISNTTTLEKTFSNSILCKDQTLFLNITENVTGSVRYDEQFYGLPLAVKECFLRCRGITNLYDWQNDCLCLPAVHERKNLVYSLPTSGGKTLVAEILIMKELLIENRNAILVLPYVSIVQEKVRGLSPFAVDLGFHIEEYAANKGAIPPKKRRKKRSVYIATIEKANAIVNNLIELDRMNELGMVVVDELHMIGEGGGRGALLEILLSKVMFKFHHTQIIGMSATLGNMVELKSFLNAETYTNNFRPVELDEYIKINGTLFKLDKVDYSGDLLRAVRSVTHLNGLPKTLCSRDPDHILTLVLEVIPHNSCLIFCPTKKNCENVALMLAKSMPRELMEVRKKERKQLLTVIQTAIHGVCATLNCTIMFGIAYHHSGLTMDERKLIEEAYSAGVLCLLCCTSTLAAGVNLPAKRVILRSPKVGSQMMSRGQYKQMIGRAGRAGIDSSGESILILQPREKKECGRLLDGPIGSCRSSLFYEKGKGFRRLLLSLLGLKICSSLSEMESFLQTTLYYIQLSEDVEVVLSSQIKMEFAQLESLGMLTHGCEKIELTSLGMATIKGCMDIDVTPFIYRELSRAQEFGIILANELHLLYLATPIDQSHAIYLNWMLYYKQVNKLDPINLKSAEFVGVSESILSKKATGKRCHKDSYEEIVYKRFFLALMLFELMKKKTVLQVSEIFEVQRGFVQNLLASAISFTSLLIHFTSELNEFWALKLLFQALLERLSHTNTLELMPLMEIPGVKQVRARQLFKANYRTLKDLASADVEELVAGITNLPRTQAKLIVSSAKMLLQEKVEALREEADEIEALQKE